MKRMILLGVVCLPLLAAPIATGQLSLPKSLTTKAKGIRVVYISVLDPASGPMPCAAQKLELKKDAVGSFTKFSLEPEKLTMMGCTEIPAVFNLKVKLDKDGYAGPDSEGDIVGRVENVKKGSGNISVTLDVAK